MDDSSFTLKPIGVIRSMLVDLADAPRQGDEGSYEAWLEIQPEFTQGLTGIKAGDELLVLAWLHRGDRSVLQVRPRGNQNNPLTGVFATRSPDRPNPIGLHRVSVLVVEGQRLKVAPIETIDGTPIVDIKPVLSSDIKDR